jgi:hypothetical protein
MYASRENQGSPDVSRHLPNEQQICNAFVHYEMRSVVICATSKHHASTTETEQGVRKRPCNHDHLHLLCLSIS